MLPMDTILENPHVLPRHTPMLIDYELNALAQVLWKMHAKNMAKAISAPLDQVLAATLELLANQPKEQGEVLITDRALVSMV